MGSFKRWQDSKLWMLGKTCVFFLFLTRLGDGFTMNPGRLSSWSSVASWIMSTSTGWIQQHRRIKQSDKAGLHYWPHLMEHRCKSWHTFWIRDLQLLPCLPLVYQVYSCRSPQRSEPPHLGALLRFLWRGARQHADIALDHLHKAGNSIGSDWCNVNRWWVTSSKRLHNYGTTHPFFYRWIIYYKWAISDYGYVKLLDFQPPGCWILGGWPSENWSTRSVNPGVKIGNCSKSTGFPRLKVGFMPFN